MSGNPFRTSLVIQNHHPVAAHPTSFLAADSNSDRADEREHGLVLNVSSEPPSKTKKSVRIESPVETVPPHPASRYAGDELYRSSGRGHHAGSPPPEASPIAADEFEEIHPQDPAEGDVEKRTVLGNTWKSSEVFPSVLSTSGAPANPFARTLATLEPQEGGGDTAVLPRAGERTAAERPTLGIKRQSLNVESFKNLLMQGISSPRGSGPPPQSAPSSNPPSQIPTTFESSSSTDTSSVSRNSIFEAAQEPHPESPRTSYDMAPSDDEQVSLVGGETAKKEKKKPPPTPRHRHGKLVKDRTPQTVSFEDFSVVETMPTPEPSKKTDSNLNKPLPPNPPTAISLATHIISEDMLKETALINETNDRDLATVSEVSVYPKPTVKKVPPPVPLARRQSQLRNSTAGSRSRSNSSLTISSQHSTEVSFNQSGQEITSHPHPMTAQKSPPPPPPSRRHGNVLLATNTPSADSSTGVHKPAVSPPHSSSSRRTTLEFQPGSPTPISGLTRTPSMHSTRNASKAVTNEGVHANAGMPPPPPPPRRRQSGRSSLDMQRPSIPPGSFSPVGSRQTSAEWKRNSRSSLDGKRQGSIASVSSLSREYTPDDDQALYSPRMEDSGKPIEETDGELSEQEPSGGKGRIEGDSNASNILEDMEQFQKEIDALRSKYEKAT